MSSKEPDPLGQKTVEDLGKHYYDLITRTGEIAAKVNNLDRDFAAKTNCLEKDKNAKATRVLLIARRGC
ncbi:hypothetical protein DPV78_012824 [Talaromyces pinophilus]|nr:hypothetical protein DPV78_012824 [Talaromyces pinophilus]